MAQITKKIPGLLLSDLKEINGSEPSPLCFEDEKLIEEKITLDVIAITNEYL